MRERFIELSIRVWGFLCFSKYVGPTLVEVLTVAHIWSNARKSNLALVYSAWPKSSKLLYLCQVYIN